MSTEQLDNLSLGQLVERISDAVMVVNADSGRIVLWNPAAEQLFGYAASEALNLPVETFVPGLLRTPQWQTLVEPTAEAGGESREPVELSVYRASGDEAVIELTLSLIQAPGVEGRYVLAIIRDISQQKQAESAERRADVLREQEQLLDLAADPVVVRDLENGVILLWNRRAEEFYGWSKDEVLGKAEHELLQTAFPQSLQDIESELIWQGAWEGELTQSTREGRQVAVGSRWLFQRDEQQRPIALIEINRDLSASQQAAEQERAAEEARQQAEAQRAELEAGERAAREALEARERAAIEELEARRQDLAEAQRREEEMRAALAAERAARAESEAQRAEAEAQRAELEAREQAAREALEARGREAEDASQREQEAARREQEAHEAAEWERRQRERVAGLLDAVPGAVFSIDAEGRVSYVNSQAADLLGRSREDLLGASLWSQFPELETSGLGEAVRGALAEQEARETSATLPGREQPLGTRVVPADSSAIITLWETGRGAQAATRWQAQGEAQRRPRPEYQQSVQAVLRPALPSLADWCSVDLLEPDGSLRRAAVVVANPAHEQAARTIQERYPADAGAQFGVGKVLRSGQPQIIAEVPASLLEAIAEDQEHLQLLRDLGVSSVMIVPIEGRDRTLGALSLTASDPMRRYDTTDLVNAEDLARRVALLVGQTNAETQARQALERTARLRDLSLALAQARTDDEVARVAVEQGVAALGARAGSLVCLTANGRELEVACAVGYADDAVDAWRRFSINAPVPLAAVVRSGQPAFPAVRAEAGAYPDLAGVKPSVGEGAWAAVPIQVQDRVIGALSLSFPEQREFQEEDRVFLTALGVQAGLGFERAALYQSEQGARGEVGSAREQLEFLLRTSQELAGAKGYDSTLQQVARIGLPTLADWSAVDIVDEEGAITRVAVATADSRKEQTARELQQRYPSEPLPFGLPKVLRTGQAQLIREMPEQLLSIVAQDQDHLRLLRDLGFNSVMVVPLRVRDRILGSIMFVSADPSRHYGDADLRLAEDLARRAALATEYARLSQGSRRRSQGGAAVTSGQGAAASAQGAPAPSGQNAAISAEQQGGGQLAIAGQPSASVEVQAAQPQAEPEAVPTNGDASPAEPQQAPRSSESSRARRNRGGSTEG